MKIQTGIYKGRNFFIPAHIRPTTGMTRKAVFDFLGQDLQDMAFIDLFAGSGAMGLEALSIGAKQVVVVEKDPQCADVIEHNMKLLGISEEERDGAFEFMSTDVFIAIKLLAKEKRKFDILFADPPYEEGLAKKTLKTLGPYDILHPNSIVIIEHSKREILPETEGRFSIIRHRNYGKAFLSIYQ